ncbi:MAG: FadR family transcriptional regulator [Treponema sp.]|jgi:DNA-binding FadR family transcriptional regulator|nr:FadR family transcriptional regulator [Treponema sp.]
MSKINISNMVVENIKRDILIGKYQLGDKLEDERTLAEKYKISRMTLRKALVALREEGIINTRHGVGNFVENINQNLLSKRDVHYFLYNEKLIMETLLSRVLLEAEGCALAAQNADPEDVDAIQKSLFLTIDEIKKLKQGLPNRFFEADLAFHETVAAASHYPLIVNFLKVLEESVSLHQFLSLQVTEPADEVITYHTAIYGAIISKDGERAREAMTNHLYRVVDLITKNLEQMSRATGLRDQ